MIFPNWFFRNQVQINRGVAGAERTSLIFFTACTDDLLLFVWTRRVSRDLQIILLLWKWNTDQQKRKQTLHPLKYFKLKPLTFKQFFRTTTNINSKLIHCFVFKTQSLQNKRLIRNCDVYKLLVLKNCLNGSGLRSKRCLWSEDMKEAISRLSKYSKKPSHTIL